MNRLPLRAVRDHPEYGSLLIDECAALTVGTSVQAQSMRLAVAKLRQGGDATRVNQEVLGSQPLSIVNPPSYHRMLWATVDPATGVSEWLVTRHLIVLSLDHVGDLLRPTQTSAQLGDVRPHVCERIGISTGHRVLWRTSKP